MVAMEAAWHVDAFEWQSSPRWWEKFFGWLKLKADHSACVVVHGLCIGFAKSMHKENGPMQIVQGIAWHVLVWRHQENFLEWQMGDPQQGEFYTVSDFADCSLLTFTPSSCAGEFLRPVQKKSLRWRGVNV